MKVVICGGGIMGCSTAFHLAKKDVTSVIVEQHGVACAASGKAGGFLAKDWCDHFEVGPLARASFELHMEYSEALECDYRRVDTLQVEFAESDQGPKHHRKRPPPWVDGHLQRVTLMGDTSTTAQVHPRKLCEAFVTSAQAMADAEVRVGRVEGFRRDGDRVTGVLVRGDDGELETLPADAVVIAMGPWSGRALQWLDLPGLVTGRRAHGIVLRPKVQRMDAVTPHALFSEVVLPGGQPRSAEVYPRPDGTIYMCGMSDDKDLPDSAAGVQVDPDIAARIKQVGNGVSSVIAEANVETRNACYMPVTNDGLPIIGPVPGRPGAFVGAGHSCWGILNGPATGKALADLVLTGRCDWLDLGPFDPARLLS